MATALTSPRTTCLPTNWSLADIQNHLGGIPIARIRSFPPPGLATLEDAEDLTNRKEAICELIDGILVEKPMGYFESLLASLIISRLAPFVYEHQLGIVLGEAGTLQILPDQVRIPDVSFISWARFPDGKLPKESVPAVVPDLAIEILSRSNTEREMDRKRQDYFQAGVKILWIIDPATRTTTVFTAAEDAGQPVAIDEPLSATSILPGFTLTLADLLAHAERQIPNENPLQ